MSKPECSVLGPNPSSSIKKASDLTVGQAADILAHTFAVGYEKRARTLVMEKLAEPPAGGGIGDWLGQNVVNPLAKYTGSRPEAVQRIGGGLLGGLGIGALGGLGAGMQQPRKRRNLFGNAALGAVLGGTLGGAGGIGYDAWKTYGKEQPPAQPPPEAKPQGPLGHLADAAVNGPKAMAGNANSSQRGILSNLTRTLSRPGSPEAIAQHLTSGPLKIALDPEKARALARGGPKAVHDMLSAAAMEGGGGIAHDAAGNEMRIVPDEAYAGLPNQVPLSKAEELLNGMPMEPSGILGHAAHYLNDKMPSVGNATAESLGLATAADLGGVGYRRLFPANKDMLAGAARMQNQPAANIGMTATPNIRANVAQAAETAAASRGSLEKELFRPHRVALNDAKAMTDPVRRAAQMAEAESAKNLAHASVDAARRAANEHVSTSGGAGLMGGRYRGAHAARIPYYATAALAPYMMFDQPYKGMNPRIGALYDAGFKARLQARGVPGVGTPEPHQ
jgi:uncharacterized membrane protein YebE (DUF533 family)